MNNTKHNNTNKNQQTGIKHRARKATFAENPEITDIGGKKTHNRQILIPTTTPPTTIPTTPIHKRNKDKTTTTLQQLTITIKRRTKAKSLHISPLPLRA